MLEFKPERRKVHENSSDFRCTGNGAVPEGKTQSRTVQMCVLSVGIPGEICHERVKNLTMNPAQEIRRLFDLMPASGRMNTKIFSQPTQLKVIESPFPMPWHRERRISINFERWSQLSQPQRDLLMLRTVSWLSSIQWFKPDWQRGLVVIGALGAASELFQGDAIGMLAAGGLTAFAASRIWSQTRSSESELLADETALEIAQRRGYSKPEAAKHLLGTLETVAKIEGRPALSFTELIRCQNLRAIAGVSSVGVPDGMRSD
jgi:Protein of unknown function (DUF3318)